MVIALIFGIILFWQIDKNFWHLIFEPKPGSCLILEEKYCKNFEVKYYDNKEVAWVVYKLPNKAVIFFPIDGKYNQIELKRDNGEILKKGVITLADYGIDIKDKYWYELSFFGNSNSKLFKKGKIETIKKGEILGYISKKYSNQEQNMSITIKSTILKDEKMIETTDFNEIKKIIGSNIK